MPKRIALRIINLVWYSTALLLVLTAVLATTGRELLPRIDFNNEKLLRYISERVGADIQATDFRCQWTQLYPEFNARQIVIQTPALYVQLDNVKTDINILRSLLQKTLVLDQLHLTQANIRYTQPTLTPGQTTPAPSTTAPDIEKIWHDVNLLLSDVRINDIRAEWHTGDKERTLHLNDFRVEQTFSGKKFFLRTLDGQGKENLRATGDVRGNSLRGSDGTLYVQATDWQLDEWVTLPVQSRITQGEIWLTWEGMDEARIVTQIDMEPKAVADSTFSLPESVHTALSAHWKKNKNSTISIHTVSTTHDKKTQPVLADTLVTINNKNLSKWHIQTPALDLGNLASLTHYLPDGDLKRLFASLHPQGVLRNLDLQWDNSKPLTERMQLRATADNISSGAWSGVPAFTQVSGYLQSGIGNGFIDLDSHNGFSMFYSSIYHEAMPFQHASGRVQWQWQPDTHTVFVGSDYASLSGESGEARGNFWLRIPTDHTPGEMYLAIGLRNSEARFRNTFLPFILPANLLSWLKTSIGDAALPNAGFIYRGPLSDVAHHASSIQFFADIRQGQVQFDPAWPALKQLDATLLVDDTNAVIRASSGKLYDTSIQGAYVEVLSQDHGLTVNVNARSNGPAKDGLRILQETPLKNAMGTTADNWRMPQGSLSTALQLKIPLGDTNNKPEEDVRLSFSGTQLGMGDLKLDFKNINGGVRYSNSKGLEAPELNATLFDKPVQLTITSDTTAGNTPVTNISAKGSANTSDIANWAQIKALKMLGGSLDYNANLKIGNSGNPSTKQIGQLEITSNMKPVTLALPAPFTKQRGEEKPFRLVVDLLQNNRQDYRLEYNKQISGIFGIQNGNLLGGELVLLGDTATMPSANNPGSPPFRIRGTLPSGDLQPWLDLISTYNQLPAFPTSSTGNTTSTNTANTSKSTLYPDLSLTVNNATWKDLSFPKLQLYAGHDNDAWEIYFDSGHARGSAFFYDSQRIPDITLSELKLYRDKNTTTTTNSNNALQTDINFASIPSLNIRIDHLLVDDMDIGSFSTELRTNNNTLRLEKLLATGNGYQLRDGSGTTGSSLVWRRAADGSYQSEFHGLLHMQGKQPALAQLGIDMFIIGESIDLYADISWPGSPQQINVNNINGNIYTRGKNGKYLQAKPNTAMRALGVINVATWARRLQLDFSDLSNDGISFDEYKGKLAFNKGVMRFSEPLQVESPSSALSLSGTALLREETLDLQLVATLPVGNNATWIAALAGGLPAAAGVYVVSKVFDKQIVDLTSLSYGITGPMSDPNIRFQRIAAPMKKP